MSVSSIGLSGIRAAEAQLQTAAANIANANVQGYSLETVQLVPDGDGAGVRVSGIQRASAPFLSREINADSASAAFNAALFQVTNSAQAILSPSGGGDISGLLQNLFNMFESLSASPEDTVIRQQVVSAAQQFADASVIVTNSLRGVAETSAAGLSELVGEANSALRQVADLNRQIAAVRSSGGNFGPLEDQRDQLIATIAALTGAEGDVQGDVSLGGIPLVSGTDSYSLVLTGSSSTISIDLPGGPIQLPSEAIGGTIGGTLAGVEQVLSLAQKINILIDSTSAAINSVHASGFGLDGSSGNALFTIPATPGPIAINSAIGPDQIAASSRGMPGDGSNAGSIARLSSQQGIAPAFGLSTASQAWGQIVAAFGEVVKGANDSSRQSQAAAQALENFRSSITGVSINEQLALILQYENELQASGRVVAAASDMISFLIQTLQ